MGVAFMHKSMEWNASSYIAMALQGGADMGNGVCMSDEHSKHSTYTATMNAVATRRIEQKHAHTIRRDMPCKCSYTLRAYGPARCRSDFRSTVPSSSENEESVGRYEYCLRFLALTLTASVALGPRDATAWSTRNSRGRFTVCGKHTHTYTHYSRVTKKPWLHHSTTSRAKQTSPPV